MPRQVQITMLEAFIARAEEGMVALDAKARVLFLNPAAERLLGQSSVELRGSPMNEAIPGFAEHVRRVGQMQQADQEITLVRPDGSERKVVCLSTPVADGDRVIGSVVLLRCRQPEQEAQGLRRDLAETQRQLIQSQKLASIGQLAAGIAHEINNPVAYVSSNLATLACYTRTLFEALAAYRALEREVDLRSPALAHLHALIGGAEFDFLAQDLPELLHECAEGMARVRAIVQDLKDFSRAVPEQWQVVDLHGALDDTLNILHHETKYKAHIVRNYGDIPPVECIGSQINQVFMNLLINASQALEEQGTISVTTLCPAPDLVCISIADDGIGMSGEVMAHVFDPFFTTKPVGKGTGLGLALSDTIVRKHGGRIDVESVPGKGTTFHVFLPVFHERPEQA